VKQNVVVCPHPDPYIMAENISQLLKRLKAVSALLKDRKQFPADIVISRGEWCFLDLCHSSPHLDSRQPPVTAKYEFQKN